MTNRIENLPFVEACHYFDEINSTNTFAKSLAVPAGDKFSVVWAGRQSAGRGRNDRAFFSSVNGGLWVSLVVPLADIAHHFAVNRSLSLAVADFLESLAPADAVKIKWPNDIYWHSRKICGILLESSNVAQHAVVAGFGLDLAIGRDEFPPAVAAIATSVLTETNTRVELADALVAILTAFRRHCHAPHEIGQRLYTARLYRLGAPVVINGRKGIFQGVDEAGRLCLAEGGAVRHLTSGSIEFVDPA